MIYHVKIITGLILLIKRSFCLYLYTAAVTQTILLP